MNPRIRSPTTGQRAICHGCPILAACRRYAKESCEGYAFLDGLSPAQRQAGRSKRAEIAKRSRQVRALRALGAPTHVIAELVGRDPSLVRGDLRAIDQQAAGDVEQQRHPQTESLRRR